MLDLMCRRLRFRSVAIAAVVICGVRLFHIVDRFLDTLAHFLQFRLIAHKFSESGARRGGESKRHKERKVLHGTPSRVGAT